MCLFVNELAQHVDHFKDGRPYLTIAWATSPCSHGFREVYPAIRGGVGHCTRQRLQDRRDSLRGASEQDVLQAARAARL